MNDIATLKVRAEEAHAAATLAQRLYEQALMDAHPWQVGTVLRSTRGTEAKVLGIKVLCGRVVVHAAKRRKDGTFGNGLGTNRVTVWGWESDWRNCEVVA